MVIVLLHSLCMDCYFCSSFSHAYVGKMTHVKCPLILGLSAFILLPVSFWIGFFLPECPLFISQQIAKKNMRFCNDAGVKRVHYFAGPSPLF